MYVGLVNETGRSICFEGYHHVCLDGVHWRLNNDGGERGEDMTLLNVSVVKFPRSIHPWGRVRGAVFEEADLEIPLQILRSEPMYIPAGVETSYAAGNLRISCKLIR